MDSQLSRRNGETGHLPAAISKPAKTTPRDAGIHRLIEAESRHRPAAVAIEFEGREVSYAELDARADGLARRLREQGVRRGRLVGLFAGRGVEAVVGMLGVLKAGGAFVPFDPAYPAERLAFMLRDARPTVVVAESQRAGELPVGPGRVVVVDTTGPHDDTSASRRSVAVGPEDLAYAIYTSGSTGRPKAAMLTHRGLRYLVPGQIEAFGVTPASRVLQFAPLGFDAAVSEVFVTLAAGATLCLADPTRLVPGPSLARTLAELRISLVTLPPTVLARLPEADLPNLETIVVAGERCPAEVASRWSRGRRFLNAYGPTEATVCATVHECPSGEQPAPPIGRPLAGCEAHVLDEGLRPVPDGEPGELHLGGAGLARGYLRRPRLTATKFIRHPFSDDPEDRLYRTGDLVRRRADGAFEFLDRTDDQVKIRGVRVEPGEVTAALERHPGVAASAVLAEHGPEGARLVAYVARRPERALDVRELYRHLRESLPLSLLPAEIVPLELDRWPLSPSGKVDKQALRKAARSGAVNGHCTKRERVEPRDATEYRLAELWGEVLEGRAVGVTDDFFEAGGDSLAALDLLARVERTFGRAVPIGELIATPTVEGLARAVRRADPAEWSPLVPLRATGSGRPLFCVHPGGGGVLCYVELARAVGPARPVYALQAPGVDGVRPPLKTVEEMAAEYVSAIRSVRPTGPYDLCGWSFGAVVAYEMARRLTAAGHEVSSLTLIDGGFLYSFAVLRALLPKEFLLAPVWSDRERLTAPFREFADRAGIVPPGASEVQAAHALDVFLANVTALMDFRPEPYAGRATLLLGEERLETGRHDPAVEWRRLCTVDVRRVPGGHLTLLRPPFVEAVAAWVGGSAINGQRSAVEGNGS